MKQKKILIGVIITLVVVIGIIAFVIFPGIKKGTADGTTITSFHLESFPEGTQMGPGLEGTETTTIKIGELVQVSGTVTTDGAVDSSIKIFDAENNLILEQQCVKVKGTGGFGCSMDYPRVSGIYTLKFYIEDTEERSLNFEVRE